ncbi:hypothetical protein BSCG_02661 [Bacteroides sp. 2_2_4]|jgi:hypothetical protein|uniref:hypothetical protein n=1 Tax=Bacteroides sp. 2_2_4 TaxID=469590 RepID=UPI0001A2393E|nr:hypothetical protein [Bacteroides sp. 2_2_4]EEO55735.1 hypothetical protein BSCG_02661 [Bacteroides sp. 2_2_4]DAX36371.1 MAG TPA: hypothetical protein [Caudoviricetes sp.]
MENQRDFHQEARLRLPDPREYSEEKCSRKVYYSEHEYVEFFFEKIYGLEHEKSVDWTCVGSVKKKDE